MYVSVRATAGELKGFCLVSVTLKLRGASSLNFFFSPHSTSESEVYYVCAFLCVTSTCQTYIWKFHIMVEYKF